MEQTLREIAARLHESGDRKQAQLDLQKEVALRRSNVEGATLSALDALSEGALDGDCVDLLIHAADVEGASACGCAL